MRDFLNFETGLGQQNRFDGSHLTWYKNSMPVKCPDRKRALRSRWYKDHPARRLREGARARAREKGLEYNLEHGDVFIPERCPVLGIVLKAGGPGGVDSSPTLDRIDNTKGYVKGNVIVVSRLANQIKSTATYKQVRRVAEFYEFLEVFPEQAVTPPLDHLPKVRELFLTPDIVRAIRTDPRKSGVIAKEYGLGYNRVSDIKARRTWAKLPDDEF